jgi:centromere protein I
LADIEPPSQIIAALDDPLLQKYLVLVERPDLQRRFDGWLSLYLDGQTAAAAGHHAADKALGEVLEKALSFHHHTKVRSLIR